MSSTTITNISYAGTTQVGNVVGTYGIPVNAYLWGGGGGGTSQASGNAGGYSKVYFVAKPGDILTVAVGQGGGRGGENINGWTPSGFPGASYSGLLFNTRFPPAGQDAPVYPYGQGLRNTSSNVTSFLSQWGVWGADQSVQTFTRTYTINFPTTDNVIFQMVASTFGRVYLDGNLIVSGAGRSNTSVYDDTINQAFVKVTAGVHTITIQADGNGAPPNPNSGNPNAIGVIFGTGDQTTYSGGRGGQLYPPEAGIQDSAGGGGGATILSLNGVVIAIAAGGGGGATRLATDASTDFRYNNGQDGQDINTAQGIYENRSGGGGGGGGGLWAGQGGTAGGGAPRAGGTAGTNGTSLGDVTAHTVGRVPYINEYYPYGGVAEGGANGVTATRYIGTTATDPFHSVNLSGSGYYVRNTGPSGGSNSVIGYYVIVNGTVIYQSLGGAAVAPPATLAIKAGFVGYSYNQTFDVDGVPHYENVECFSFDYITSTYTDGGNGFIALEYQTGGGAAVKDGDEWKLAQDIYVKDDGIWKQVQTTYINEDGIWKPIKGAPVPTFTSVNGAFGPASRSFGSRLTIPPPPPAPAYDYGGSTGYGSSDMF